MSKAVIAYLNRNGTIKSVTVDEQGEIDELGFQLNENFLDLVDVKEIVVTSIIKIEDGEVEFDNIEYPEEYDFSEYDTKSSFIEEIEPDLYYYLYENGTWFVKKPNFDEFKELELILDEEY